MKSAAVMKITMNDDGTETIRLAPWDVNGLCRNVKSLPEVYQLVTEIQLMSPDQKSATISDMAMSDLADIITLTKCNKIYFTRILFQSRFSRFAKMNFPYLESIIVDNCEEHLELIAKFISVSPKLRSFLEVNPLDRSLLGGDVKRDQRLANYLGSITQALDINPRLTIFESPSLFEELKLLLADSSVKAAYRTCLKQYHKLLPEALKRNHDAYQNYRRAMYQILLIKKFRLDSVFRFINRDIVRMIVGLIKASKWEPVWRP